MANNMPSIAALLGLVAVAGYQNRDKISDFVKGISNHGVPASAPAGGGLGGAVGGALGGLAANAAVPGGIGGALGGLISHMQQNGAGDAATSWVGTGSNLPITGAQLTQALGPDLVNKISASTGLSADQIVTQLGAVLPQVVDQLTPHGKVPA